MADGDTTLSIKVLELDESGLESLQSHVYDSNTHWYYERRRAALIATGILADGYIDVLHPRGRDGRFIDKFGFVRWMSDGKWKRGQVIGFDEKNGAIHVRSSTGEEHKFPPAYARQHMYSLPKPKATLKLPDPKNKGSAAGFTKIGGQGGSNPGALYQVSDFTEGRTAMTSNTAKLAYQQVRNEPDGSKTYKMRPLDFDINEQSNMIRGDLKKNGLLFDNSRNKVFVINKDGTIRDPVTGTPVSATEVFGASGSAERLERIDQFDYVDNLDQQQMGHLRTTMQNLVQQIPNDGDKFYVKTAKSKDHAKNEALANMLYEMGGVPIPDVSIGDDGVTVASKIVAGDKVESLKDYVNDPHSDVMQRIREDMVFDAWLANWDVAGLTYDNIIVVDGVPHRIDAGGALSYRAQGGSKGKMFGDKVGEIDTLKSKSINQQAGTVFGPVSQSELMQGGQRLAAISPHDIRQAVAEHGLDESMADTLIARRADVLTQIGVPIPVDLPPPVKIKSAPSPQMEELISLDPNAPPVYPDDLTGMIWNPALKNFIKGETNWAWTADLQEYVDSVKEKGVMFDNKSDGEILQSGAQNEKVYAFVDSQLYEITGKYSPAFDGVELTYRHTVTGDTFKRQSAGIVPTLKPEVAESVLLEWRGRYARRETRIVDNKDKASEANLAMDAIANGFDTGVNTVPWKGSLVDVSSGQVKPGDWLYDRVESRFIRVDQLTANNVTGTYLDGTPYTSDLNNPLQFRRRAPGSAIDSVLDSMKARNEVAAKNYHDDETFEELEELTAGDAKMQATIADKPNVTSPGLSTAPPPPKAGDVPPPPPVPDGELNPAIALSGEPVQIKSMTMDQGNALLGKTVYMQLATEPTKNQYGGYTPPRGRGIFTVTGVEEGTSYSGGPKPILTIKDSVGHTRTLNQYNGTEMELIEADTQIAPLTQFQLKTDNTVVANGEVVGEWTKHYGGKYRINIDAKYSATGQDFQQYVWKKSGLKEVAIPIIIPPGSAKARPKSQKHASLESAIRQADIKFSEPHQTSATGEAVTLLDGAHIEKNMWVVSKTDGSIGQVTDVNTSYLGYVNVKYPDGKTKIRSAKTLSASHDPDAKVAPPPAPMYKDVKLSDGSPALPGQQVLSGSSPLVIIQLKADGSASVMHADGKKTWMKASKLAPAQVYVPPAPEDTAVAMAKANESWKIAPKPKKIPYAAPGDVTIPQAQDAVATYREFNQVRKLTKDQFVPQIGMKVRDSKGKQGSIVRIAPTTSSNPSAVWVLFEGDYKAQVKQPSTLWVDHAAELASADGKPLPSISSIYFSNTDKASVLPNGSVVYKTKKQQYVNGRSTMMDHYIVALPDGSVREMTANSTESKVYKDDVESYAVSGGLTRVAYVDETAGGMMTVESATGSSGLVSAVYVHKSEPGELEKLKQEIAEKQLASGEIVPEKFAGSNNQLIRLPKPTTAGDKVPVQSQVKPFTAVADGSKLKGPATVAGSYSMETGIDQLLSQRNSGTAGQSVVYAMGDADYIEDESVRLHMAVDAVTGEEMIEIRFGLLETQADDLAKRLITNQGTVVGDWAVTETKMPTDLKAGDAVSVKISQSTGALKPGNESFPNSRVVGTPEHVGESKAGLPLYRVEVAMASGATGYMLLEQRATPSMKTFEWDPSKVQYSSSFNGTVNQDAVNIGWSARNLNAVAYEGLSGHSGKTLFDAQGRKIVKKDDDGILSIASVAGAARMQYDHPAGDAYMTVQIVHPDAENRNREVDHLKGIRSNVNGEVLIRVNANDPNALEKISSMMSAVGVPPEKQGQPSADDLTRMALNKVYKQFNPTYTHMEQANVGGTNDTAGVQKVLSKIDNAVGPQLGRPATIDDIHLRVLPDGRVTVVLSDDVADAIVKKANFTHAYHSFTGGGWKPEILTSPASVGLLSTDERWSLGIVTSGMSSKADTTNDSGNRIYFRLSDKKSGSIGHSGQMLISAKAIAKTTDWYWNSGDRYGKRGSSNLQAITTSSFGGSNEVMLKKKIDPELMGFVMFPSESARQAAIADSKKKGVTMVGTRPIEDVFRVGATVADIEGLGADAGVEIPLTAIA